MNTEEYDKMKHTTDSIAYIKENIIAKIPEHIRPFISLKYCEGTKIAERTAKALVDAILMFIKHVNISKKCTVFIGHSPFRFNVKPVGSFIYEHDSSIMASAIEGNIIFLDFHILSDIPNDDVRAAYILEELVHTFLDVPGHPLANQIVCLFHGKVELNHREEYEEC